MVDEAHSIGVLGPQGRGLCTEVGLRPEILMGTLGKALGVAGAFVAGPPELTRLLMHRARSYVFSTAPPPPVAAAVCAALDLSLAADLDRARLHSHAARLREGLQSSGYQVTSDATHIVPVRIGDPERTMSLSRALLDRGVFAHGIRPPTVPRGTSRIRLTPMARHTDEHIDRALAAFAELANEYAR
jgi:7-keto-8-aminopelargonate synthetase-like enzyme